MYEIYIQNGDIVEKVHEMNQDSTRRVAACKFSRGVNMIEEADFVVYPSNPCYNKLNDRTTMVKIVNTITGNTVFDGFVAKTYDNGMKNTGIVSKSVSCDGTLAYLNDTIQVYRKYTDTPVAEVVQSILTEHNNMSDAIKHIYLGSCDISGVKSFETEYQSTLETIKSNILDTIPNIEISIRRNTNDGKLYLDITKSSDATKRDTTIELADNMVSLTEETDAEHVVTRLIPLGAYIEDSDGNRTGQRYDITSLGNREVSGIVHQDGKPYIDDTNAISQYGIIVGTAIFDNVVTAEGLFQSGGIYIQNNNRIKKSYSAEVLDLSLIGLKPDELEPGGIYRFVNKLIPIDEDLRIQKITVDIFNAHQPSLEIGEKLEKITSVAARQAKLIEYELPKQKLDILDSAKATASALIKSGFNGYVVANANEICIMNTPDKETSTKVWRWTLGGFGYSSGERAYYGNYTTAMTMDGAIVADFITAGILRGIEITNGNGTFHVDSNGTCTANTFNSNNVNITGGKIEINSNSETYDAIKLNSGGWHSSLEPLGLKVTNDGLNAYVNIQAGNIFLKRSGDGYTTDFWSIENTVYTLSQRIGLLQNAVNDHESRISALENS